MAAILDTQSGRRYGQVQFVNEVVDYITTEEGRQPCYDLLETLQASQEGIANSASSTTTVTLGSVRARTTPSRTLIPRQAEHRFHAKPNSHSTASRTPIPRQAEQSAASTWNR